MKSYLKLLASSFAIVILLYLLNLGLVLLTGYTIRVIPVALSQLINLLVFVFIGVSAFQYVLPSLDKFYNKPINSILGFALEHVIYGIFLANILYFVYGISFVHNPLVNSIIWVSTLLLTILPHEFGHFIVAYFKGYKPLLIPLRFVHHFEKGANPLRATLAMTIFFGKSSRLLSAAGPLMNLAAAIVGIVSLIIINVSLGEYFTYVMAATVVFNGLLFLYNITELFSS